MNFGKVVAMMDPITLRIEEFTVELIIHMNNNLKEEFGPGGDSVSMTSSLQHFKMDDRDILFSFPTALQNGRPRHFLLGQPR